MSQDITPTHVVREDAIAQCLNKASEELFEAGLPDTANEVILIRERFTHMASCNMDPKLNELIPNEDLATWIDG